MAMNIIEFLQDDHRKVEDLFARFDEGEDTSSAVVAALTNHDKIEMHILYPAIETDLPDLHEELQHAKKEHSEIRGILDKIIGSAAAHDDNAKSEGMAELKDSVEHHVAEEEATIFPAVLAGIDGEKLNTMGNEAAASKF